MLCLYVYNVLPPQRLPGSFEDRLCNGQRKIKETRFKKKKNEVSILNGCGDIFDEKVLRNYGRTDGRMDGRNHGQM